MPVIIVKRHRTPRGPDDDRLPWYMNDLRWTTNRQHALPVHEEWAAAYLITKADDGFTYWTEDAGDVDPRSSPPRTCVVRLRTNTRADFYWVAGGAALGRGMAPNPGASVDLTRQGMAFGAWLPRDDYATLMTEDEAAALVLVLIGDPSNGPNEDESVAVVVR